MSSFKEALLGVSVLLLSAQAEGRTLYVDAHNILHSDSPYTNWHTAATRIQDAVGIAVDGDTVLVTNGVYDSGSTLLNDARSRVVLTNAIVVQSVNGPTNTFIVGEGPIGVTAVRRVYAGTNARLSGFTRSDGSAVDYVDASRSSTTTYYWPVYTIRFRSALPGQTLTVKWTMNTDSGSGRMILSAATLQ